jgi:hypothetical protein
MFVSGREDQRLSGMASRKLAAPALWELLLFYTESGSHQINLERGSKCLK